MKMAMYIDGKSLMPARSHILPVGFTAAMIIIMAIITIITRLQKQSRKKNCVDSQKRKKEKRKTDDNIRWV